VAANPEFFTTPTLQASVISATAYGGTRTSPTGLTTIYTGSTTTTIHHQIRKIDVKTLLTSAAALLDFWLYDGTTYYMLPLSQAVTAITGGTGTDPWATSITFPEGNGGLILPGRASTAWTLAAGFSVTQTTAAACVVQGASS
jgi:hypothetical protein